MALYTYPETNGNWKKYKNNPVLGSSALGTCFDVFILKDCDGLRMYFSWRPKKSLAVSLSRDGIKWSEPRIILEPKYDTGWEDDLNRNCVVKVGDKYHMYYTGQARGHSYIGYAVSDNGYDWERYGDLPVLVSESYWENRSVMNPHVIFDEDENIFKMWYSGGETYEPNSIGYAVSSDGVNWIKHKANPIFVSMHGNMYEQDRIGACQIIKGKDEYTMFYIGYENIDIARICVAKSPDGITRWERCKHNPIISPTEGSWDSHACYKPYAVFNESENKWYLYYNGRSGGAEYIGLVTHDGYDLF